MANPCAILSKSTQWRATRLSTFIAVGNAYQPFSRLLKAATSFAYLLPKPVVVQYGHTPFRDRTYDAVAYLDPAAFDKAIANATVVILHAGAGCVIHALRCKKIPIVMARRTVFGEHIDDHQVAFAEKLHKVGKVIAIDCAQDLETAVARSQIMKKSDILPEPPITKIIAGILQEYANRP